MIFVGGAHIAIRVIDDDVERRRAGAKAVEQVGRNHERQTGAQHELSGRREAGPLATQDQADAKRRMHMPGLRGARRDMEVIRAGIPEDRRREQEGVGAAIDVPQAARCFDGPPSWKQPR